MSGRSSSRMACGDQRHASATLIPPVIVTESGSACGTDAPARGAQDGLRLTVIRGGVTHQSRLDPDVRVMTRTHLRGASVVTS